MFATKRAKGIVENPAFIIVFGSYAYGSARKDSDLDIAYVADKPLSGYERFLLAGIDVDLIDIKTVDTVKRYRR